MSIRGDIEQQDLGEVVSPRATERTKIEGQ